MNTTTDNPGAMDAAEEQLPLFRDCGKLVRGLTYVQRINAKPASIRVTLQTERKSIKRKAKETMFSLEDKGFYEQYARAVKAIADFRGIPADSPIRTELAATGPEFLRHYGLQTKTVTIEVAFKPEG